MIGRSKNLVLAFLLTALIVAAVVPATGSPQSEKKTMRLGSSSPGSTAYIHFEACAFLVNKYSSEYKASSISTAGSSENVVLLGEGKLDVGSAGTLDVYAAWEGQRWEKVIPVWQICSYTYWPQPMIALADSEVNTVAELKGKSVSLIKKGSGAEYMWRIILEEYGIIDDVKKNYLAWDESYDALADGLIVACPGNYPGGTPNPAMERLATRKDYKALEIDQDVLKRANKRNPGILVTTLPKSAYKGFSRDVPCGGIAGVILSTAAVDDDLVYEFCKAVYEHTDELHEMSKVSGATTLETATKWLMSEYPVHPGAVRYFKEKGVWNEDLKIGQR
jgi:TRAP transporter TAXI family solute receptor